MPFIAKKALSSGNAVVMTVTLVGREQLQALVKFSTDPTPEDWIEFQADFKLAANEAGFEPDYDTTASVVPN